jgi:hypothetical protein
MVTKATAKKSNKVEKFEVTGFEEKIARARRLQAEIEAKQAEIQEIRSDVTTKCDMYRKTWEKKGKFYKTFSINSADGTPASVVFKNQFSNIDISSEQEMRIVLGDTFNELYEIKKTVALNRGYDSEMMKKLLGSRYHEFFTEQEVIVNRGGFLEKRAELRAGMEAKLNKKLDEYSSSMQAVPEFRLKG